MRHCLAVAVFAALLSSCLAVAAGPAGPSLGAPAGTLIEGEAALASDSKPVNDASASGGAAAANQGDWKPLVSVDVPPSEPGALTLWVRHKGGPMQLKTVVDGKQVERAWNWSKPSEWTWSGFGRLSKADLGSKLVFMIGQGAGRTMIDCVVLSSDAQAHPKGMKPDGGRELPPFRPDAQAPAETIDVSIDWDRTSGRIGPMNWGMNDYEIADPKTAADPAFQSLLASMHPGLIRIHWADLSNAWTDPKTRTWNAAKIKAGFKASTGYKGAKIMLTINWWPDWLAKTPDGVLPTDKEAEFIKLVGELVRVMRDEVKQPIDYWELLNEREETYEKAGKLDQLWSLHKRLFDEIRRQDPSAKVGGPAFTWAKPQWVDSFLAACGSDVDFVSWHNYGIGDLTEPNDKLMSLIDTIEGNAKYLRDRTRATQPGRDVKLFLTEYNVKWTWDPFERRHANNVGAVFQACVVHRMADLGVDGCTVWHVKGNAYGLIDGSDVPRPTGALYQMAGNTVLGELVSTKISDPTALELMAVKRADGKRVVLLMNKSDHDVTFDAATLQLASGNADPLVQRIDADSFGPVKWSADAKDGRYRLPGYSVTLLTQP